MKGPVAVDTYQPPLKRRPGRPRKHFPPDGEPPPKRPKLEARTPTLRNHTGALYHATPKAEDPDDNFILRSDVLDPELTSTPAAEETTVSPKIIRARTQSRSRRSYARERLRDHRAAPRPRFSSAAAAAAATQASDGYKPREERSWEEFHPDLDIEAGLVVYTADEVDGRIRVSAKLSGLRQETTQSEGTPDGLGIEGVDEHAVDTAEDHAQPARRRPGRPPRRPESMLTGLGSPPAPRIMPIPTHNPKERLNLPKPSYRHVQTFKAYEEDKKIRAEDYVDKAMANVGYQESERFDVPRSHLIRHLEPTNDDELGAGLTLASDHKDESQPPAHQLGDVEYDMDEQDERWLEMHNAHRKTEQTEPIRPSIFEITMTQIEREFYALEKRIPKPNPKHANHARPRSSSAAAVNGEPWGGDEPDSKCAICDDGDCENANAIIFCDGCDLAVHQECYGVPFIPEGQWFCRKCKEIGRGTPTCIFCPNIDGAFKQTTTLRWAHLLCAIWIPEVTIANPTYMEPIMDVDKVPRNRWSLVCYICNQRMGACIQCSNKSCYQAFHVTCARRAKLFLKMKATPTSGIDTTILKAFCDKHVPPEWRRDQDTDTAIVNAKKYYRKTMRHRRWADSQAAALAMITSEGAPVEPTTEIEASDEKGALALAEPKKKKKDGKTGWKLPSGAPVVPYVVFTAVETALLRFTIRRRKEFVAEACKYWTLKREARRGAALLKRLQLQLEGSSAMEITRRNFVGMGAAGRPRLIRRIEFVEILSKDVVGLIALVDAIQEREQKKLEDAENLAHLVDTVYFPIPTLLWPILNKARKLAEKSPSFEEGLAVIEDRLQDRHYTSVAEFSSDIGSLFAAIVTKPDLSTEGSKHDITELHSQMAPMSITERQGLSAEQKQQKSVAKRIVRAIKEPLEAALRKEAELRGEHYQNEQEWAKLDAKLESALAASDDKASVVSMVGTDNPVVMPDNASVSATSGASANNGVPTEPVVDIPAPSVAEAELKPSDTDAADPATVHDVSITTDPAINLESTDVLSSGGVPWYMRAFDPHGTTIHDERWLGPDRSRALSEDLSDVDEATLMQLEDAAVASSSTKDSSTAVSGKAAKSKGKGKSRAQSPLKKRVTRGSVGKIGVEVDADEGQDADGDGNGDVDMLDGSVQVSTLTRASRRGRAAEGVIVEDNAKTTATPGTARRSTRRTGG